jgi:hypothetical protein
MEAGSLLSDGSMDIGKCCWGVVDQNSIGFMGELDADEFHSAPTSMRLENPREQSAYGVQLIQPVQMQSGHQYQLSFWARASSPRSLVVEVSNGTEDGLYSNETLRTEWMNVFRSFTVEHATASARLVFSLGTSTATVWLDDVRLEDLGPFVACGNGVIETGETCDPPASCPTSATCNDGNVCTTDTFTGSAAGCTAMCRFVTRSCGPTSDGCCPMNCTRQEDPDCPTGCNDGLCNGGDAGVSCLMDCRPDEPTDSSDTMQDGSPSDGDDKTTIRIERVGCSIGHPLSPLGCAAIGCLFILVWSWHRRNGQT